MLHVNKSTKFLLSIVIAGIIGLAAWRIFTGQASMPSQLSTPEQTKSGPHSIRANEPQPVAAETEDSRFKAPPETGSPSSLPIEIKETPAGQVKILRTFDPDGKLRHEEVMLNGQLQAVKNANSEGQIALEIREDPEGQIKIQRTFNLADGQVVKEEAFQNGVAVPLPQKAEWD